MVGENGMYMPVAPANGYQMSRYQNREMGGMYPPMKPRRW